jgi:hypothetical protein
MGHTRPPTIISAKHFHLKPGHKHMREGICLLVNHVSWNMVVITLLHFDYRNNGFIGLYNLEFLFLKIIFKMKK